MGKNLLYIYYPYLQVKRKICSLKYMTIILLVGFMSFLYMANLKKLCSVTGTPVTPWLFPFLISIKFYCLVYCALYMYFYSDVPFIQRNAMYHIIRCGRIKWGIIQIESIMISSFVFNMVSFIISVSAMIPYVAFETGWGKILYTLSRTDARKIYEIALYVPYNSLREYSPLQLMLLTLLLLWLAGSCLGLMMFAVSLWAGKTVAVLLASLWCILPIILDDFISIWKPLFTHLSPLSWVRILDIGSMKYNTPVLPTLSYILIAYTVLCIIFGWAALTKLKSVDLKWSDEEC